MIDGFCSAGNTGAMMIGATQVITVLPGIIRPAIAGVIPNMTGKPCLLLDVGINPDARPDVLNQYGLIGKVYAQSIFGVENPRIGLVNIGTEEEKGNLVSKSAYQLMKDTKDYNFIGNVEANELFTDPRADVLVCDGFIGNIILKEAEGFYKLIKAKNLGNGFFESFNFENFGGTPVLGVNKPVVVGHGISNAKAIMNMVLHTYQAAKSQMIFNLNSAINGTD
jgi:glycerol-3-phosphate acyltransferase PlsX